MRAIVLTSSMRRHSYVANPIAERLDVDCVWRERSRSSRCPMPNLSMMKR